MKTKLSIDKSEFEKELNGYIQSGQTILDNFLKPKISPEEFQSIEKEYDYWIDEVEELLKQRFDNPNNEYYNSFKNAGSFNTSSLTAVMRGANPDDIRFRYKYFKDRIEPRIENLISLSKKLKFIPDTLQNSNQVIDNTNMTNPKIFISHSSLDSKIVEKVIDTLEAIGVPSDKIFCSSFEGYGVKLGSDFLDIIKNELDNEVLVLFILSNNFYSSVVSLCEMGATWVKTNQHIPILIPPFNYGDIKGVIPTTHGMKINEKEKFNTLKEIVENFIGLTPVGVSVWERRRDKILKEIKEVLDLSNIVSSTTISKGKSESNNEPEEYDSEDINAKIKELSKKEWPEDFEMQLDYIQKQQKAVAELKAHKPMDIDDEDFQLIRRKAKEEWADDFEMQLDYEQKQVESLRRLKNI